MKKGNTVSQEKLMNGWMDAVVSLYANEAQFKQNKLGWGSGHLVSCQNQMSDVIKYAAY